MVLHRQDVREHLGELTHGQQIVSIWGGRKSALIAEEVAGNYAAVRRQAMRPQIAIHAPLARQCDRGEGRQARSRRIPQPAWRWTRISATGARPHLNPSWRGRSTRLAELMRIEGEEEKDPPPRRAKASGAPRGADKAYEWCSFFAPSPSAGASAGATGSHVVAAPSEQCRVFGITS